MACSIAVETVREGHACVDQRTQNNSYLLILVGDQDCLHPNILFYYLFLLLVLVFLFLFIFIMMIIIIVTVFDCYYRHLYEASQDCADISSQLDAQKRHAVHTKKALIEQNIRELCVTIHGSICGNFWKCLCKQGKPRGVCMVQA